MFFTTCFYQIFECTHKICKSHIYTTAEVSITLLVQVHVFSLTWLYFIWLKLSSIWWGYFLCNLVNCCFVIVAHNKIIAKKWQSVRLANVLASRSALNDIYLPSLILSPLPSFLLHSFYSHLSLEWKALRQSGTWKIDAEVSLIFAWKWWNVHHVSLNLLGNFCHLLVWQEDFQT